MESRVLKTSIGSFLQMGLLSLSSLIITIALSRLLSVEEFGVFSLANALVFFMIIVFTGGIPSSMARFISLSQDGLYRHKVISNGFKILVPWILICSGLYLLFYQLIVTYFFNDYYFSGLGVIIFSIAIIEVARQLIEKLSHGISRMSVAAELSAYSSVFLVTLLMFAAWRYSSAEAVLIAKILALLLPIPWVVMKLATVFNQAVIEEKAVAVSSREIVLYGIPLSIVALAAYCFLQADLLFLGRYWDASYVGWYSICVFVYMRLTIVPRAIGNGLAPYLARVGYMPSSMAKLERGMIYALAFSTPVALFCAAEPENLLIIVFGEKYAPAAPIFMMLSLYFLMASLLAVLNPILDFSGKASARAVGVVLGGGVNIALDILWVPVYHMEGAAWATLIGYFVFFIIVMINVERKVIWHLFYSKKIRSLVFVCFLVALVTLVIKYFLSNYSYMLTLLTFVFLYPILLFVTKVFGLQDINEIKTFFSR